jgi:hypothetical protein
MSNLRVNRSCWLIGDAGGCAPVLASQFARLRGLEVRDGRGSAGPESSLPSARSGSDPLIATTFAAFDRMTSRERESLRASVNSGATLYLRGGASYGVRHRLAPLLDSSFTVGLASEVAGYRFTDHPMIPSVLRSEETPLAEALNCVSDLSGPAEPILLARHQSGAESPVVFAYRIGRGAIICDVQPDDETADTPLIWRMADPLQRRVNASAMIAADRVAGRDPSNAVPFNLTIDDIPLGYDYLNESMLEDFLDHAGSRYAGMHLDCAWIPTSQLISRRYVEMLKDRGAGFVWHGMHRHVDHQKIEDPVAEMAAGKRAMAANMQRYGAQLQPIIIFPFERAHRSAEQLLLDEGFLAAAEQPRHDEDAAGMPGYLSYSNESCEHESGLRFLHRYESAFLTRDRMIALASLGLPILAFGHPKDVRLRRLSRFVERGGTFSYFDEVLDFASAKGLPGRSLEGIARELFDKKNESMQLQCA